MRLKCSVYLLCVILVWGLALVAQPTEQAAQQESKTPDASSLSAYDPGDDVTPPVLIDKNKDRSFDELPPGEGRQRGYVTLLALVGESGRVDTVEVQKSWGGPELDTRAVAAAKSLEFRPGTKNGVPVRTRVVLEVVFWKYRSQIIMEPITSASVSPQVFEGIGLVYRVAKGVTPAKPTKSPDPEYPKEARKQRYEGTSVLWVVVDTNGLPREVGVTRPTGHGLDEKAIEAVKKWRFTPAMKDGKTVPVLINVEMSFHLY